MVSNVFVSSLASTACLLPPNTLNGGTNRVYLSVIEDNFVDNRDDLQAQRRLRRLMGILDTMGPRRRMAFVLHAIEGKPMREVAEILEITPQAVKSRVFQARRELLRKAAGDPYLREFLEELDG